MKKQVDNIIDAAREQWGCSEESKSKKERFTSNNNSDIALTHKKKSEHV